ncbi:hypothetical protein PG999_011703 [Apiospora kogelbergensis]|uniref:Uncharacterized protein n=1 Tax=Apiospora kogelbergensis TaxID=1337665 RepID=A0AAW0QQ47_9PEZI
MDSVLVGAPSVQRDSRAVNSFWTKQTNQEIPTSARRLVGRPEISRFSHEIIELPPAGTHDLLPRIRIFAQVSLSLEQPIPRGAPVDVVGLHVAPIIDKEERVERCPERRAAALVDVGPAPAEKNLEDPAAASAKPQSFERIGKHEVSHES